MAKSRPRAPVRPDSAPLSGLHGCGIAGIRGGLGLSGLGGIAGGDDGFESLALVLEVALGGFDEIRDEVVAALQLDVDLGEGVLEAVLEGDETIVLADHVQGHDGHDGDEDQQWYH